MKAIAKVRPEPGLEIIDIEEPQLKPGHVKVKVERGSVCGTDLHIYNWDRWSAGRIKPPRVIGHEFCGTIVEVADDVTDRKVGDFVASESHIVDENSPQYLAGMGHIDKTTRLLGVDVDGGFCPYAVIPAMNARLVPSVVPKDVASMLDALGNAVHTVMDGPVEGKKILITGLGPIGLFAGAICKALGAEKVYATEVKDFRIEMGEQVGIDMILNPAKENVAEIMARLEPDGIDGTLEMSGHPSSLDLAIQSTAAGGRISLLGIFPDTLREVDFNQIIFKGLQMHGIIGRKMWETWDQMIWLLTEKNLNVSPVVTHQMLYTEFNEAMTIMNDGRAGKIVLNFSE
ncbi:MAG: L-threonine 3-dehydrogenase [Armatimonadetes bacterium]|nr:L-threonine 3-dehydrogenase [Armatimonadota bacterium]